MKAKEKPHRYTKGEDRGWKVETVDNIVVCHIVDFHMPKNRASLLHKKTLVYMPNISRDIYKCFAHSQGQVEFDKNSYCRTSSDLNFLTAKHVGIYDITYNTTNETTYVKLMQSRQATNTRTKG